MVRNTFEKHVQIGRVVALKAVKDEGKIAVILDVVDSGRVLLQGPTSGVARQVFPIANLTLTTQVVNIRRRSKARDLT